MFFNLASASNTLPISFVYFHLYIIINYYFHQNVVSDILAEKKMPKNKVPLDIRNSPFAKICFKNVLPTGHIAGKLLCQPIYKLFILFTAFFVGKLLLYI